MEIENETRVVIILSIVCNNTMSLLSIRRHLQFQVLNIYLDQWVSFQRKHISLVRLKLLFVLRSLATYSVQYRIHNHRRIHTHTHTGAHTRVELLVWEM